jgi:hypothetical protein
MKRISLLLIGLMLLGTLPAQELIQSKDFDYTSYGQMIYWKALNPAEKKVFLHAYLYRTHEITGLMKANRKLKSVAAKYSEELADPVYTIFRDLDEDQKNNLIFWIDTFYQNEYNQEQNFFEALKYASDKVKSGSKSMNDIYRKTYPH